jgi:hypothetical protein
MTLIGSPATDVTYYTVSDHRFFLGTVALFNSLRLTGNNGNLVVLDIGLAQNERESLLVHAQVVSPPPQIAGANPITLTPYPHFFAPSGTIVLIDSDILVTGRLDGILTSAREGKVCVYPDMPGARNRWFAEWEKTLRLRAPLRREVSVNAGFIALSTDRWPQLLERWWELCQLVPTDEIGGDGTAFNAGDQDALNALLMSEFPRSEVALLPEEDVAFAYHISLDDVDELRCSVNGQQKKILHFLDSPKPWQRSGWLRLASTDYIRLMRRVLFAPDVPLRLDPSEAPIWLQPTRIGRVSLGALGTANRVVVWSSRRTPGWVANRLRIARRRLARRLSTSGRP